MPSIADQTDPIVRSILRLTEGLAEIQNEQKYLRMREHNHRDRKYIFNLFLFACYIYTRMTFKVAEETNDKIFYWSIVEILVLIVTSVAQVFILKRFFKEDKRRF